MSEEFFEHQLCFLTARILVPISEGLNSVGTGFLYSSSLPDYPDLSAILLISNKHVFCDPSKSIQIEFNEKLVNGDPEYGKLKKFEQNNFSNIYYEHPDSITDLACVNISGISSSNVYYKNLDDKFLKDIDYKKIHPGSDVLFIGYPENRFDAINNLPLIRKGSIASVPYIDFNGRPEVVIDAQVFQGSSGSPVFVADNGHYKLLGVVSETMIKHSQLQTISAVSSGVGVQQILGLGIVIKQSKVVELIQYAINEISRAHTEKINSE